MKEARAYLESGKMKKAAQAPTHEVTSIPDAIEKWLKICEKEGLNGREPITRYTLKNYQYRAEFIKAYSWPKPIQELLPPDIVEFRSWLLRGEISRGVAAQIMASLHSLLKEMTIRGIIPYNVATGISIRTESRYKQPVVIPSKKDIISLLQAADRLANSKNLTIANAWERYRPILYLAADSGMRPQEYLAISNSALDKHGVHVLRAIDGSGHSLSVTKTAAGRRYIELSPDVLDMLRHYSERHAAPNEYGLVFPAENGRWMCRKNWQRRGFNTACMKAGLITKVEKKGEMVEVPKFRPYDLRHFFASVLIERNTNLKKIQTLMGHSNIETTLNVYGHLLEKEENAKIEQLGLLSTLIPESCGKPVARIL
jgi:integrase